jgi:hypothetical protein
MRANSTPKRTRAQCEPIYRADGRIIGEVRGDTFYKTIHDAHILTTPRGISSDVDALRQAESAGAKFFCAHHVESRRDYIAPIARFFARGIKLNRGHSPQIALLISDFNHDDDTPTPTQEAKPTQLPLFPLPRVW